MKKKILFLWLFFCFRVDCMLPEVFLPDFKSYDDFNPYEGIEHLFQDYDNFEGIFLNGALDKSYDDSTHKIKEKKAKKKRGKKDTEYVPKEDPRSEGDEKCVLMKTITRKKRSKMKKRRRREVENIGYEPKKRKMAENSAELEKVILPHIYEWFRLKNTIRGGFLKDAPHKFLVNP